MADQALELRLRLQGETLASIRADRERASVRVAELLGIIEEHLFDPDLDVNALLRLSKQRNKNVSTRFATELGRAPKAYILEKRMELAGRMLVASTFQVWRVGVQVGYLTPGSFNRAFKTWSGKSPKVFRKAAASPAGEEPASAPVELVSRQELQQAIDGHLPPEQAETLVGQLFDLGEQIGARYRTSSRSPAGDLAVESAMARNLWELIEQQPHEMQQRAVESQAPAYRTQVLFNRLCTVSVEAEDDVRALQLANLVLISVRPLAEHLEREEGINVVARAWTVAGHAQRRAGELDEADQNFLVATRMLQEAGDAAHPVIVAELCFFKATLEIVRDNFGEARKLMKGGYEILRLVDHRLSGPPSADAGPSPQT